MIIKIDQQLVSALERLAEQRRTNSTQLVNDLIFAEIAKSMKPTERAVQEPRRKEKRRDDKRREPEITYRSPDRRPGSGKK